MLNLYLLIITAKTQQTPEILFEEQREDAKEQQERFKKEWPYVIFMLQMLQTKTDHRLYDSIRPHYFPDKDAKKVAHVWCSLLGAKNEKDSCYSEGDKILHRIVFTNDKRANYGCKKTKYGVSLAFLTNIRGKGTAALRICDEGWKFPSLDEVSCSKLGSRVGWQTNSLAGIIVHELMHFNPIAEHAVGEKIIDHEYRPLHTREFAKNEAAVFNADSYTWMAQEYYWSHVCKKEFSYLNSNRDSHDCAECIVQ